MWNDRYSRWFQKWRRSRGLRQLEQYLRLALDAPDDQTLTATIDKARALMRKLEASGAITQQERLALGREWVRDCTCLMRTGARTPRRSRSSGGF